MSRISRASRLGERTSKTGTRWVPSRPLLMVISMPFNNTLTYCSTNAFSFTTSFAHLIHTRTGSSNLYNFTGFCREVQLPQKQFRHLRQWCLRFKVVKSKPHPKHFSTSSSFTYLGSSIPGTAAVSLLMEAWPESAAPPPPRELVGGVVVVVVVCACVWVAEG